MITQRLFDEMDVDFITSSDMVEFYITDRVKASANINTGHLAVYVDGEIKQVYKDVKLSFVKSVLMQACEVAEML